MMRLVASERPAGMRPARIDEPGVAFPIVDLTVQTIGGPQYGGKPHWEHHFDALKRMLDRREPEYKH